MIKALLWDMDGVILDSEPLHDKVLDMVLEKFGHQSTPEDRVRFMGASSEKMWTELKAQYSLDADVNTLIEMQWETIISELPGSGIPASEGLKDVLTYAKEQGIKSAIVSSSRRDFIEAVTRYLNIEEYINYIVDGFKVKNGKPSPEIYNLALKTGGFRPEECLVIEDSTNGVGAGINAGITVIGYDNPTSFGQDISRADYKVKDLSEIINILKHRN